MILRSAARIDRQRKKGGAAGLPSERESKAAGALSLLLSDDGLRPTKGLTASGDYSLKGVCKI
jgi:hypothetical protein